MHKELTEEILRQVKRIKRDLTVVEAVMEKFCAGKLSRDEVEEIIWNNIVRITGEVQRLISLLRDFGESGEVGKAEEKM